MVKKMENQTLCMMQSFWIKEGGKNGYILDKKSME